MMLLLDMYFIIVFLITPLNGLISEWVFNKNAPNEYIIIMIHHFIKKNVETLFY